MGARKLSCQFIERRTSREEVSFEQIGSVQRHDLFVRPFSFESCPGFAPAHHVELPSFPVTQI